MDEDKFFNTEWSKQLIITESVTYPEFVQKMNEGFGKEELQHLCFELGIEYDNLDGDTKKSKIVSLVQLFARSQRMIELIDLCKKERPNISWTAISEHDFQTKTENLGTNFETEDNAFIDSGKPDSEANDSEIEKIIEILATNSESSDDGCLTVLGVAVIILFIILLFLFFFGGNYSIPNRFLEPVQNYSFSDSRFTNWGFRKASTSFTGDLESGGGHDGFLEISLDIPAFKEGDSIEEKGGGICVPVISESVDAVAVLLYAPDGASALNARFSADAGEELVFSNQVDLKPGNWIPLFWGTGFVDNREQYYEWNGGNIQEVCLWIYSYQGFTGYVRIDQLVIYEVASPNLFDRATITFGR